MKLSIHRVEQLENLLRKLRQRAFDCDRCVNLIPKVKAHLQEAWNERSAANNQKHWMYAAEL